MDTIAKQAIELAARWQDRANELLTPSEKKVHNQMARLLRHPMDKVIMTRLIDQRFRSDVYKRITGSSGGTILNSFFWGTPWGRTGRW